MSRAGDVSENPITGERAVVRVGTEDSGENLLVCDVYVRPGGRVAADHVHPTIEERFTVVSGRVAAERVELEPWPAPVRERT